MTAALVGRPELLANSLKSNYYTYNYITNLNFHDLTVAALASTIYIYIYIYGTIIFSQVRPAISVTNIFLVSRRPGTYYDTQVLSYYAYGKFMPWFYSSSILVRPLLQLLTTTTISWNKTEKIGVMILKVYVHIYIVLLIVYPQFGKQSLLAPLIMSGVVRVSFKKL